MSRWQPRTQVPGQRLSVTQTTGPLLPASAGVLDFSGLGQLGHFIAVSTDAPAWLSFYGSAHAREADGTRLITADPPAGAGVLLDLATTTAGERVSAAPGCTYFQLEDTANPVLRALVRNTGAAQAAIAVTLTVVVLVP